MTKPVVLAILCGVGALSLAACDSDGKSKAPLLPPSPGPGVAQCNLNTQNPGPLIRGGQATVHISGPHVDIDRKGVPALCGPIYNVDMPKLNAKAGDGLLLETCLPEGTVQVTSYKRVPGKQPMHSSSEQAGTEVLFNKNEGSTFTSRGASSDSITLSQDMWRADIDVELVDVMGSDKLKATIRFDCPHPSPLELKTAQEKADQAKQPAQPAPAPTAPDNGSQGQPSAVQPSPAQPK